MRSAGGERDLRAGQPGASRAHVYVAVDADRAGMTAAEVLTARALDAGIEAIALCPRLEDFNEDLRLLGKAQLRGAVRHQLLPEDAARFVDGGKA
ncbi:toprim domain-containing protein [Bradyrhizobium sp. HKCCYLS20291]|uniref:toprim domain-containing protein n=1 Tax=Bradyrhizobium sp. HKCCYLS20291 TaxID=3420766 RepID=UPI003EBB7636